MPMPTNSRSAAETHRQSAQSYDDAVEKALAESRALDALERDVNDLIDGLLAAYEDFDRWESQWRDAWAARATLYDAETHQLVTRVRALWLKVFTLARTLLDKIDHHHGITGANDRRLRTHLAGMAATVLMDNGPMPTHMRECVEAAIAADAAGDIEPMDRD